MEENGVCSRCGRSSDYVKLIDTIDSNELVKICEECAMIESSVVIRRPSSEQLKNSEKPYSIRQRLSRMAGVDEKPKQKEETSYLKDISLDKLRKPKDYKAILNAKLDQAKRRNQPLNLIDNFNWHIMMARKDRKITRKQLADVIGESETSIKMIEENFLPDDALRIINKIEQYFGVNLRRGSSGIFQKISQDKEAEAPARVLKFDPQASKNITIADLQKMKAIRESETGKDVQKEVNVTELVWRAKSDESMTKEEATEENQETPEEKKSRKSFLDFFKFGKKKKEIPEESVQLYED